MEEREWYSVKCIFQHSDLAPSADETVYEERIVILLASSLDDAIEKGEIDAENYAESHGDGTVSYTGFISAYSIREKELAEKTEVYSLMRQTSLPIEEFLARYYDDGTERTQ